MGKIILYADNACDLDKEVVEKLGVKLFYMTTMIKGVTYIDRLTIDPPEFYRLLEEDDVIPTTSQVNIASMQVEFENMLQEAADAEIIYIAFSSGLSGTYQTACIARDAVDPERITVIDSQSASIGYGLIVIEAARAISAGKSKAEVIAGIYEHIKGMQHIFIVGSLEMLKRGGRVNPAVAALGNLLNIKLILHFVEGKIVPLEKVHGLKKAKKRLLDIMEERGCDLQSQTIGISYSQDLEGALEIKHMIEERFGSTEYVISEIGALIGAHVGAGTFAVFFLSRQ
ncbi:MAG: DegV family protein [Syntrophomonadaceae bacterium]|nr:DegV family protein [Syntrophomonadaceae bacterium]